MKKIRIVIFAVVLALSLSACNYSDYRKAVSAMEQQEYKTALEIFQTISDYKDSAELATECAYQMAIETFNLEDYETAYNSFTELAEYKDSTQKANECSVFLGYVAANAMKEDIVDAVTRKDENQLFELIVSYMTMDHAHEEISAHMDDYIVNTICAQFDTIDYDNYLFLDRIIYLANENKTLMSDIGNRLSAFDAENNEQRIIAFLTGTWKRVDSSQSSGLRIGVTYTEENTFAMILEDLSFNSNIIKSAKFHWDKGMVIWNDIQITDPRHITMDTMWLTSYYALGVQSNRYEDCIGYLDFEGMRIITQSTGEENILWRDNFGSDIYVKESAIKDVSALSENDFVIHLNEENETFESNVVNLNEWFSKTKKLFYAYSDVNSLTTERGITVGSEWHDVVAQYGYGRGNLYVEADDTIHALLKKSKEKDETSGELLCNILTSQADEYMEYPLNDTTQIIRFYFDDGIVSWICIYTA